MRLFFILMLVIMLYFLIFVYGNHQVPSYINQRTLSPHIISSREYGYYIKGMHCKYWSCRYPNICMGLFYHKLKFMYPEFCELPEKACIIGSNLPCPPVEKGNFVKKMQFFIIPNFRWVRELRKFWNFHSSFALSRQTYAYLHKRTAVFSSVPNDWAQLWTSSMQNRWAGILQNVEPSIMGHTSKKIRKNAKNWKFLGSSKEVSLLWTTFSTSQNRNFLWVRAFKKVFLGCRQRRCPKTSSRTTA